MITLVHFFWQVLWKTLNHFYYHAQGWPQIYICDPNQDQNSEIFPIIWMSQSLFFMLSFLKVKLSKLFNEFSLRPYIALSHSG